MTSLGLEKSEVLSTRVRHADPARAESGIVPLCYGASRNVFPSGMARDMGAGLKAYKLLATADSGTSDLVAIFGCGPDVDPVSVEVQREQCTRLLMNSLRQKGR